jgi:septal ring factor EnvC (AmiA/AmiB activator)
MSTENSKYPLVSAAAMVEAFEALNEGIWITEEALNNIEASISEHADASAALNSNVAQLETTVEGLNATIAANEAVVSARDARIAELEGEVAKLKAGPAADLTGTSKEKDDVGPEGIIGSDPVNAEAARLRAMRNSK